MQLSSNRPRHESGSRLSDVPMAELMSKDMARRALAVDAAFVICGGVSAEEVFVSDVLEVAEFLLGPQPGPLLEHQDGGEAL